MDEESIGRLAAGIGADRTIGTHISWVLLAKDHAYKVKKPVRFSFLDFSTPELRERFCREELRLNRRLSPDVYMDVVEVKERDGAISVGGVGRTIEHALVMKRLDTSRMMDGLLRKGEVREGTVREIARMVADFHGRIERLTEGFGSPETVFAQMDDLRNHEGAIGEACGMADDVGPLLDRCRAFVERNRGLLQARMRDGFIRDCHGDLHSGNIFIMDEPVIIDCIEFSRDFRCVDAASEVAFMAMDLDHHGREDLSEAFVDEYLSKTHDPELGTLLPLYKCYRANVRAKVAAIDFSYSRSPDAAGRIRSYLTLAIGYSESL